MSKLFFLIALMFLATGVRAESLHYKIFDVRNPKNPILLAEGVRTYDDPDIRMQVRNYRGEIHWSKVLPLEGGFVVGASIFREAQIQGFGIWARRSRCGFSWEWFNATTQDRFEKLQESGVLSVQYRQVGLKQEISKITFNSDVSLRLNESRMPLRTTHRILIKKGSVLLLPAYADSREARAPSVLPACETG